MVNTCVVWGCTNRSKPGDDGLKFFDIPKVIKHQGQQTGELSTERRRLWLARINRANFDPDPSKRHYKVCSQHFVTGVKADLFDKANPDWAPSLKLGPVESTTPESCQKRYMRTQARKQKRTQIQAAEALFELQEGPSIVSPDEGSIQSVEELFPAERFKCEFLIKGKLSQEVRESQDQREIKRLKLDNILLREKLNAGTGDISPDTFKDEEKVKHYTGLNIDEFVHVPRTTYKPDVKKLVDQISKTCPCLVEVETERWCARFRISIQSESKLCIQDLS